jgi:hypothetical protein
MKRGLLQALRELLKSNPKLTLAEACAAHPDRTIPEIEKPYSLPEGFEIQ